ncbi:MAG: FAD:protein FMN transferase [Spirosomataceae bacterium]
MQKLICLCYYLCCVGALAQPQKLVFRQPKMGSVFTIQVYTTDSLQAAQAAQKAFEAVDSLNLIFSDYLPNSELSRLSQTAGKGQWIITSAALFDILSLSKTAWKKSHGAFDVTVGALTRLWRSYRKTKQLPDANTLQNALAGVSSAYLLLQPAARRIQLKRPNTLLDLGGIGKGYAAQRMLEIMQKAGFRQVLCDAAGNMAIGDAPPNKQGWLVGVQAPNPSNQLIDKLLSLHNKSISTSGDVYQFVEIQGVRYSHIVNPQTGLGLTNQRQVTVVAQDAAQADWLSTACCMLPIKKALRLVKKEKAEVLILEKVGTQLHGYSSKGWANLW